MNNVELTSQVLPNAQWLRAELQASREVRLPLTESDSFEFTRPRLEHIVQECPCGIAVETQGDLRWLLIHPDPPHLRERIPPKQELLDAALFARFFAGYLERYCRWPYVMQQLRQSDWSRLKRKALELFKHPANSGKLDKVARGVAAEFLLEMGIIALHQTTDASYSDSPFKALRSPPRTNAMFGFALKEDYFLHFPYSEFNCKLCREHEPDRREKTRTIEAEFDAVCRIRDDDRRMVYVLEVTTERQAFATKLRKHLPLQHAVDAAPGTDFNTVVVSMNDDGADDGLHVHAALSDEVNLLSKLLLTADRKNNWHYERFLRESAREGRSQVTSPSPVRASPSPAPVPRCPRL